MIVEDVPLVEFMYLVITQMPGKRYPRRLRSLLLYLCYVFPLCVDHLFLGFERTVNRKGSQLCLSRQMRVCCDKTFVATTMILVSVPANEGSMGVLSSVNLSKLQHSASDLHAHAHFLAHVHLPVLLSEFGQQGGSCYFKKILII